MDKKDLLDLIKDDDLGLLDLEKKSVSVTPEDRLLESFKEINNFFALNNIEPKSGGEIEEHKLASRLKHIRENLEHINFLKKYDNYGLLKKQNKDIEVVSEIFDDDDLDLLDIEDESILKIKHVSRKDRKKTELVARRKTCPDFYKYEALFAECQENIKNKEYTLRSFKHGDIETGTFFVLSGILLYVVSINMEKEKDSHGKEDGRLYCVFENGTESRMKYRSLQKALEIDGRTVIRSSDENKISEEDNQTGYIYILESLSRDPKISNIKDLYKIGFSTASIEERIKDAEKDPTYLMAPVSVVATYTCFNMNPQRFERLIHRFFSDSCLDIGIFDNNGKKYLPKEWFIVPIHIIEKVIELIIKGDIINYLYDRDSEELIMKK